MIFSELLFQSRLKKALDLLNCGMFVPAAERLSGILRALREGGEEAQQKAIVFYLAECYMAMGDERLEEGDAAGALADYMKAADLGVSFADLFSRMGEASLQCGDLRRARDGFLKALTLNPRYRDARLALAGTYSRQGLYASAVREYSAMREAGERCDTEGYADAMDHARRGEFKAAARILRGLFAEKPDRAKALYREGVRCYQRKRYADAIRLFQELLVGHPGFPDVLNFLGVAYCGEKAYAEAEAAFKRAIEINPDYMDPRLNLAFLYKKLYVEEEAVAVFREILVRDPGNVIAAEGLDKLTSGKEDGPAVMAHG
jgi:tetratricopeptide (TPR) repeat protein